LHIPASFSWLTLFFFCATHDTDRKQYTKTAGEGQSVAFGLLFTDSRLGNLLYNEEEERRAQARAYKEHCACA
jgi:hypothetical protein